MRHHLRRMHPLAEIRRVRRRAGWALARLREPQRAPAPFVIGVPRSGTTLLRLMLDAHPDLAVPPETHFLPKLIRLVPDAGEGEDVRAAAVGLITTAGRWRSEMEPRDVAAFEAIAGPTLAELGYELVEKPKPPDTPAG